MGRERKEMISISTTSGSSRIGTPCGTNSLRKRSPFLAKPMTDDGHEHQRRQGRR